MCSAFHEGGSFEADQTWLLQPTHGSTHLCARFQLVTNLSYWHARVSRAGTPVLVDNPRRKSQPKAGRRRQNPPKIQKLWGRMVIHIWDRGFAGSPWTKLALDHRLRFILRWNKNYHLLGPDGCKHEVWKIVRGKRSWEYRMLWDARRRCQRKTGVIALPIRLPDDDRQLFLVVSRPGSGRKPWYLITTEPVYTAEQAWLIVFAYARRWQIEMSLRFTKTEMAFESPRLIQWEARLKFLLIAALAYAFLLSLLSKTDFLFAFISRYCHRTGKWSREISAPLYRLRLALSRLWLDHRPHSLPSLISG